MSLRFCLVLLLFLDTSALAQYPHPYAYGGVTSSNAGYSIVAGDVGAGLDVSTKHITALAEIWADNSRKQRSSSGHDVGVKARAFYRMSNGWYFGGGAQWSQLVAPGYTKAQWRPTLGGGKDVIKEGFSSRLMLLYILPGTDHLNALQGPEFSMWLPSPATKSHLFCRETIGAYEFHQTSVPGNSGIGERSMGAFVESTVMYRF
jgi:hypothetical protein